ncbi:MAG: DUF3810 domain-containing protein [Eubacteriales bacterium]
MQKTKWEKLKIRWKRYIPLCLPVTLLWAVLSLLLHLIVKTNPVWADAANRYYGTAVRILTNLITGWLPFSLAEGLLLFSPVLLALLILIAVRCSAKGLRAGIRYVCVLMSVICVLYSLFVPSLGLGSDTSPLSDRLGLTEEAVSAEELAVTMQWAIDNANALCAKVDFAFGGASSMPFDNYDAMCADLMIGYERLHRDYPIFIQFPSSVKPVILSEPMSYTHITGIYTFFTGEANLNVNFPDYTLPFTAAHELAHQRGFAREKEANFIAFLVCIHAESAYSRYSGYVNMVEYLSNALYSADRALWEQTFNTLDYRIRYEMQAYNDFYDKYKENTAADISNAVNDTYLKAQGQTAGTKSYGLVVDLAVAYYKQQIAE